MTFGDDWVMYEGRSVTRAARESLRTARDGLQDRLNMLRIPQASVGLRTAGGLKVNLGKDIDDSLKVDTWEGYSVQWEVVGTTTPQDS